MKNLTGFVTQIIGPVVDVQFTQNVPPIYSALRIALNGKSELVLEVALHLGERQVRAIALGPTEGLSRGLTVTTEGKPVTVPVGKGTLGRIFNVIGNTIDSKAKLHHVKYHAIHKSSPPLTSQEVKMEVLETGIKVIDLIAPFVKGVKVA